MENVRVLINSFPIPILLIISYAMMYTCIVQCIEFWLSLQYIQNNV